MLVYPHWWGLKCRGTGRRFAAPVLLDCLGVSRGGRTAGSVDARGLIGKPPIRPFPARVRVVSQMFRRLLQAIFGPKGARPRHTPNAVIFPPRRRPRRLSVEELAQRLNTDPSRLRAFRPEYRSFTIPKRNGRKRTIHAPTPELKALQRLLDKRVFGGVRPHSAAMGFVRGRSFVHHAAMHAGKPVMVSLDLKDFFQSIKRWRVERLCEWLGWEPEATRIIADLSTYNGSLPQGAPTSPRLANILSIRMDRGLSALARSLGATYSRYADDLTFSFDADDQAKIHGLVGLARVVIWESWQFEMNLHMKRKLRIRRSVSARQEITGLVVNDGPPRLSREQRRRLRAARHNLSVGRSGGMTASQIAGWDALEQMIVRQGTPENPR